jgi:uncharacterized membrane protein
MRKKSSAFRTTAVGGLVFLVPFVVVILVGGKALGAMRNVARPLATWLGIDHVGAIAMIDIVAVVLLVLICYLAGIIATGSRMRRLQQTFDQKLLELFPRYAFVKSMTEGLGAGSGDKTLQPVLVHFDDQSQLAFEVERDADWVVLYLPGSPDPWSGTVSLVKPERVKPLDVDFGAATRCVRLAGRGTTALARRLR